MPLRHNSERQPIIEPKPPRAIRFSEKQIQKKFKHAAALGIDGNYSKENTRNFMKAIRAYIEDPTVEQIVGTYRGDPVIHYYHAERRINAITKRDGLFVSVWSLDDDQVANLEARGSL